MSSRPGRQWLVRKCQLAQLPCLSSCQAIKHFLSCPYSALVKASPSRFNPFKGPCLTEVLFLCLSLSSLRKFLFLHVHLLQIWKNQAQCGCWQPCHKVCPKRLFLKRLWPKYLQGPILTSLNQIKAFLLSNFFLESLTLSVIDSALCHSSLSFCV